MWREREMIILGDKYKLSDEDLKEIHNNFTSYYHFKQIDKIQEKEINNIIDKDNIATIVLNLEGDLDKELKTFLENLSNTHKINLILFSDFAAQHLNRCMMDINEDNLKALLSINSSYGDHILKRFFDICFSLFAITITSPAMLIIAIFIKLKSPNGSIFFTQERLGKNAKSFRVFKFRTMVVDAEAKLKKMLEENEDIREEYLKYRKLKNDPRIIPTIGNILRKTSLDELPQFFNVLLGQMSVVGPRPYIADEFHKHTQIHIDIITSVKPGITGYWQVTDRNSATFNGRVDSDIDYIKNQSLWLDFKIIFQTIMVMVFRKGA